MVKIALQASFYSKQTLKLGFTSEIEELIIAILFLYCIYYNWAWSN